MSRSRRSARSAHVRSRTCECNRACPAPALRRPLRIRRGDSRAYRPRRVAISAITRSSRERRRGRDHVSFRIHRKTGAVENNLVVASDLIDHDRRDLVPPHHGAEHLFAQFPFAQVERRAIDADDHAGALLHQLVDRIAPVEPMRPELFVVPGVFADGERYVAFACRRQTDCVSAATKLRASSKTS